MSPDFVTAYNEHETGPIRIFIINIQTATKAVSNTTCHCQANAHTFVVAVELDELLKDMRHLLLRNADACIFDYETYTIVTLLCRKCHSALLGKLKRIVKQLRQSPYCVVTIGL